MTILSDTDIKTHIAEGRLVTNGDPTRAEHCSYSFLPGRVFHAGKEDSPITFSGQSGAAEVLVGPGEMVWVRTLEEVALPEDLAGFWWQTNTLSREGLMLVNMSMVEPGYQGPLACLFVNFGRDRIPIGPQTKIAKMVFMKMSSDVTVPFTRRFDVASYDADLRKLALGHPNTFLQVADLVAGLKDERARSIAEIQLEGQKVKSAAEADLAALKQTAGAELSDLRSKALGEFQAETWKSTLKSIGWAGGALLLFTAALAGLSYVKGEFTPDVQTVARAEAEKVLDERVVVTGVPDAEANARLLRRIEEFDRRIAEMEKAP